MSVACVIIASERRRVLLRDIIVPSALAQSFDEVVVVGDYMEGEGYRYLPVPALTRTTTDALVKRDVGTLATTADWLFYLSDDHAVRGLGSVPTDEMTIVVPRRFCNSHELNMGLDAADPNRPYIGGHAGLFSRDLVRRRPWSTMPHHRLWDMLSTRIYVEMGATLARMPDWLIEDTEPGAEPWL